jgi:threonyl-tRNA synthetase
MPIHVTLPDGSPLELADGATVGDAAAAIGPRLAKAAVAGKVTAAGAADTGAAGSGTAAGAADGRLVDLSHPLSDGDTLAIVTDSAPEAVEIMRHTAAHVMAQAVLRLFPGTKYAIGPTIENGFYYDFQFTQPISDADFERIEAEMAKIVAENHSVVRQVLPGKGALDLFKAAKQPFKVELIDDLLAAAKAAGEPEPVISIYTQGEFTDLCRGPHLPGTGKLGAGAYKLTSLAGAYWRGDEKNPMLTRVYGTAFAKKEELAAYLEALEMARQRDHRRIGRDLDLFSFHEEGPGFPFFHPKGMRLWNAMIDFWREEHVKAGYEELRTPLILRRELWERSGHWENYKDYMYFTEIDGAPFAVKPMNCPGGLLVYKSRRRSYRDLPLKFAELGQVHRHEMSGVLHGLFRVRYFTQDDAHIYCMPEQLKDEVAKVVRFMHHIYAAFGFTDVHIELSTRPAKAIGSDEQWELAESTLAAVLADEKIDYQLNPGDGAFYGPKIDFHIRDVMGRTWQCGTIQVDFAMPERLDISYTGADNEEHRPVMIHRAMLGSIERFMGILLEHYGGALPTWLAPDQALVIPVSDKHQAYAAEVRDALFACGLRVALDDRSESVGRRIRDGQMQKVPYLLVVGEREVQAKAVSVRYRGEENGSMPLDEVAALIIAEVRERQLPAAVEPAATEPPAQAGQP